MSDYTSIIDQLIQLRKTKGLTQKDLAVAANLAQPAIARLESKSAVPQLDTFVKVVGALGYTIELVQE
jgi:transcriptional regulator with XRE-family HTH domain